jgi:formylmethanofuran dehydrogenase subunit D
MGLLKAPVVEISEDDAKAVGVASGDRVKVKGRLFEAFLTVKVVAGTTRGAAFIPENFEDAPVNRFFESGKRVTGVDITKV